MPVTQKAISPVFPFHFVASASAQKFFGRLAPGRNPRLLAIARQGMIPSACSGQVQTVKNWIIILSFTGASSS